MAQDAAHATQHTERAHRRTGANTYDFTSKKSLYSRSTQRGIFWTLTACIFWFSVPKIGGVLMKPFSKGSFTRFFPKKWPPRGGGGVLPDFSRRGTNYPHTTLLKRYPKSNFVDSKRMFF